MKRRRVHNRLKRRRFNKKLKEIILYFLFYACPIMILIVGLYSTYNMLILFGYNQITKLWNIDEAFMAGGIGLGSTIVLTYFTAKLMQWIISKVLFK